MAGYGYNNSSYHVDGKLTTLQTHLVGTYLNFDFASFGANYMYARDSLGRFASACTVTSLIPVGPGQINAGYGHINRSGVNAAESANDMELGYVYFLSKRTALYGLYTKIFNSSNGTTGLATINAPSDNLTSNVSVTPGYNPWALAIGIRHAF